MVNVNDEANWNKPLWLVYGHKCFPQLLCCKLNFSGALNIWGYSVYRGEPGFRTLGRDLHAWIRECREKGYELFEFYDDQEQALDRLRKLTIPRG